VNDHGEVVSISMSVRRQPSLISVVISAAVMPGDQNVAVGVWRSRSSWAGRRAASAANVRKRACFMGRFLWLGVAAMAAGAGSIPAAAPA
jgi:hypothetical protein